MTVEVDAVPLSTLTMKVGIDVGLKEFVVCSNGLRIQNLKHYKKLERRLKFLQQSLSRKQYRSRSYENQRLKVLKLHEKIFNQRKAFLHQWSTKLIRENQSIVIEHLKVTNMLKDKEKAQAIARLHGMNLDFC